MTYKEMFDKLCEDKKCIEMDKNVCKFRCENCDHNVPYEDMKIIHEEMEELLRQAVLKEMWENDI